MKGTVIFAGGAVIGSVVGILGTYFAIKKRFDERLEAEIAAFKESYTATPKYPHFDEISGVEGPEEDSESTLGHKESSSIDDGPTKTEKIAYHKMAENYRKPIVEPEEEDEEDEDAEMVGPGDDAASTDDPVADGDISIITVEQYEDDNHHEKTNLIYFVENNTLCDEFNEEIEDRELLVGDILEGLHPEEEGIIYVRNNKAYVDYEIDIIMDAWENEN